MKYDFDKTTNRFQTNSYKWDVKEGELPMWVADMDFVSFPKIKEALLEAVNRESFGYTFPTEDFFKAYQNWWHKRHHLEIKTSDMVYVSGVVSSLDSLVRLLTKEGDSVLLFSPSYNGFYNAIRNNKRKVVATDLIFKDNDFIIDYQDFETKVIENNVKAIIFCNPHNPTGKVWSKEELKKVADICERHNVYFISDEIHCDIVDPGFEYTPALAVYDKTIMCVAPSKVFNIAGLQSALTVIKDPELRQKAQEAFYHDDVGEPNCFAESATVAAYNFGDEYVDELNAYLFKNKNYIIDYFKNNLPHLKVVSGHATYLLWVDISYYQMPSDEFAKRLREETGLFLNDGLNYGENGKDYIRINIATSFNNVKDAMGRLSAFLDKREK